MLEVARFGCQEACVETTQLFRVGEWRSALVYAGLSNVLGITLVVAGYYVSRRYLISS